MTRTSWIVAAACALAVSLLSGCASFVDGQGTVVRPLASKPVDRLPSSQATDAATRLQEIALHTSDLSAGYSVELNVGGSGVSDDNGFGNCGYYFAAEADRVAQRDYEVFDPMGRATGIGNIVVAYNSPAEATSALQEWYASMKSCPSGFIRFGNGEMIRTRVFDNRRGVAGLPIATNVFTSVSRSNYAKTDFEAAIIEVRGSTLDGIFDVTYTRASTADLEGLERLASDTGARLAALG